MRTVTITRTMTGQSGTFGELVTDSGFKCRTGELPWKDNKPDISCLRADDYEVYWGDSENHGSCFRLKDKNGRENVEIHIGNYCGSKSDGYKSDVEGCILLGQNVGKLENQLAIISSDQALVAFQADMGTAPFMLSIKWTDELWKKIGGA